MSTPPAIAARPRGMVLRATMWVPKTPTELWPFFSDAHNLELLTPPFLHFQVLTPVPIAMQVGTRIDYRLRLRGIPIRWRTHIARWEPPFCFADEQERGPYRRWVHTHTFQARDRGTEIGDQVEFEVRGGPLAPLVSRWFVEPDVRRVFDYRAQQIAKRFGGDATGARLEMKAPATA